MKTMPHAPNCGCPFRDIACPRLPLAARFPQATPPPARHDEANPRGCRANGTAMHLRCNDCDYCHTHAPELASAAHAERS